MSKENNRHQPNDLKQMQSLPLEAKIRMTKERIEAWYQAWVRYEIENLDTGETRFVTWDNRDFQEPPLKENEWIRSALPGAVYVGFSGGKDSTVLKHIVDSMYDDVPALFVNTGLEYPEIQAFVKRVQRGEFDCFNSDVEIVRPEMRFDEVLKNYGYPIIGKETAKKIQEARRKPDGYAAQSFRADSERAQKYNGRFSLVRYEPLLHTDFEIADKCCDIMKKYPAKQYEKETGRKPLLGMLASESKKREYYWRKSGCNAFESKRPQSNPLAFWTEQDILHYIKKYDVPYCSVYGDIQVKRTVDNDRVIEGQLNLIDYLQCYEPEDQLETSGCDRTGQKKTAA